MGKFTPSSSSRLQGPLARAPGDNLPLVFPGCIAGQVHSAQQAEEDWQSKIGMAYYMQVIGSS